MNLTISQLKESIEDTNHLVQKTKKKISSAPIKKRSKQEVQKIIEERIEAKKERLLKKESWQKFWEKDSTELKKSRGGFRRPKTFRTDYLEETEAPLINEEENSAPPPPAPLQ